MFLEMGWRSPGKQLRCAGEGVEMVRVTHEPLSVEREEKVQYGKCIIIIYDDI